MRLLVVLTAAILLSGNALGAPAMTTPMTMAPTGGVCAWGNGVYSNGARMCVSAARLMICVNGEWRVDETRTPFTEDVCRQDNPRAPVFGK